MYIQSRFKLFILVLALCCTLFSGCSFCEAGYFEGTMMEEASEQLNDTEEEQTEEMSLEEIPVYVCGAVNSPGVYYVPLGSIKENVLKAAGGFAYGAAADYVNLAETVTSGEKVYFPYETQVEGDLLPLETEYDSVMQDGKVNINRATKEELMTLPGIGESKADAILTYREENGPFESIQDITNISGIKEGVYNNIKEHIVVD